MQTKKQREQVLKYNKEIGYAKIADPDVLKRRYSGNDDRETHIKKMAEEGKKRKENELNLKSDGRKLLNF